MIKLKPSLNNLVYSVLNHCDDLFPYMLDIGNNKVLLKTKTVKGTERESIVNQKFNIKFFYLTMIKYQNVMREIVCIFNIIPQ